MISLEQVQLLESRVAKAIEYVQKVTAENNSLSEEKAALSEEKAALSSEKASLQSKLAANQKRLDELELLVMRFKEDQGRIEDGIMAALDRLSQFETAFESNLKEKIVVKKPMEKKQKQEKNEEQNSSGAKEFFEIPKAETQAAATLANSGSNEESAVELDIF